MDQEQPQQTREEFDAEVESAFNQTVSPGDEPELTVYEEKPDDNGGSADDGEKEVESEEVDTDPVVFGGLRESQVKSLLERAARVDAI